MDSNEWIIGYKLTNNSTKNLTAAEIIPVSVLAIEAALGIVFNLAALLTYSQQKRRMLQNPGNIFTVSILTSKQSNKLSSFSKKNINKIRRKNKLVVDNIVPKW